jgi:hypothetical protein
MGRTASALIGAIASAALCSPALAQDAPLRTSQDSGPVRPTATPPAPVKGSCRAERVCRDARPLGDFGPPRQVCQLNTICDGLRARALH